MVFNCLPTLYGFYATYIFVLLGCCRWICGKKCPGHPTTLKLKLKRLMSCEIVDGCCAVDSELEQRGKNIVPPAVGTTSDRAMLQNTTHHHYFILLLWLWSVIATDKELVTARATCDSNGTGKDPTCLPLPTIIMLRCFKPIAFITVIPHRLSQITFK